MSVRKIIPIGGRPIAAYAGDTIGVEPGSSAAAAPGSECGDPWGKTWFVSPTFAGTTQNGSATCPFLTAQEAADAAADGDAIVLGQGNAGAVNVGAKSLSFFGLASTLEGNLAELGDVTGTPARLSFENLLVSSVDCAGAVLTFSGSRVNDGPIACGGINATETVFEFAPANGITVDTFASSFRDCSFSTTGEGTPTLTMQTFGASFDWVSARSFQASWTYAAPSSVSAIPSDLEPNDWYGDGGDGGLAAGFGVLTLTRDMFWSNVSFQAGDSIRPNGFRIFVSGLLDLRGAPAGAIDWIGQAGANAVGQTAGGAAGPFTSGSLGTGGSGNAGGKGGAIGGAGTAGSGSDGTVRTYTGGIGGSGGDGGASTGAAGKGGAQTAGPAFNVTTTRSVGLPYGLAFSLSATVPRGGGPTAGGGGGGGGADVGGGGGGGAVGAWPGLVQARCIVRDNTTNAAALRCTGHVGGTGGNAGAGGGAGGGGGGGEGATGIAVVADWLLGTEVTAITLNGGTGGTGGNGTGGAAGGTGGRGGDSGTRLRTQRIRTLTDVAGGSGGVAGSGPTGSTGGAGGAGGTMTANL